MDPTRPRIKVSFHGSHGCGKRSLLQCVLHGPSVFTSSIQPTIGLDFVFKEVENDNDRRAHTDDPDNKIRKTTLMLWDSRGSERYRSVSPMLWRGSAAVCLCVPVHNLLSDDAVARLHENRSGGAGSSSWPSWTTDSRGGTLAYTDYWLKQARDAIEKLGEEPPLVIILVVTKCDLIISNDVKKSQKHKQASNDDDDDEEERPVLADEVDDIEACVREYAESRNIPEIFFTSAKTGFGVQDLVDRLSVLDKALPSPSASKQSVQLTNTNNNNQQSSLFNRLCGGC